MIPCLHCAIENTDDSFYCKHCGSQLQNAAGSPSEDLTTTKDAPLGAVARGTLIGERYRVGELLGQGGMGVVYRAETAEGADTVAVKFLRPSHRGSGIAQQRFQREIDVAKRLDHPHLVKVLDSGVWEETSFLVMEFVDGASMKERIRRGKTLEVEATLPLLRQLCDGIQAVHEAGVVHRDVKPSNVLMTREGDVKVCDFGLAFTEGVGLTRITQTGMGMGTPEYMAPEQIEGRRVDSRADIYSLGVLMYEAFTGELPFVGENAMAVIMQHLNRAPFPPSTLNASLPVWLEGIILRAIEKEPSRRFQSMDEIRRELAPSRSGRRTERHPATSSLMTRTRVHRGLPSTRKTNGRSGRSRRRSRSVSASTSSSDRRSRGRRRILSCTHSRTGRTARCFAASWNTRRAPSSNRRRGGRA